MKKLVNKLRRKRSQEAPSRITNDTIAEHRERILAGGRRFKYPVQYARHRLVINAIIVAVSALVLLTVFIWWQLYYVQNSSDLVYRITRVVPLPVASVDGTAVSYSDYLLKYRSSIHYLTEKEQVNLTKPDGQRQAEHIKQESMQDAIADAYAKKLAQQQSVSVSDVEVQAFIENKRKAVASGVSVSTYNAVIRDWYGWSPDEYEQAIAAKLLVQKVSYKIDTQASELAGLLRQKIQEGQTDLTAIASSLNETKPNSVTVAASGMVPLTNEDNGLTEAAVKLQIGAVSTIIQPATGNGYYVVKLLEKTATQLNYQYVHIPLTAFDSQLAQLKKDKKISIFITIPDSNKD